MPTYSDDDFERVAAAVGADATDVKRHAGALEEAARWYCLDRGTFDEAPKRAEQSLPSTRRKKMLAIAGSCRSLLNNVSAKPQRKERIDASWRRLLKGLGISEPAQAAGGPGDPDTFQVMTFPNGSNQDHVLGLVQSLVRVPQAPGELKAVAELERLAAAAADAATHLGDLTVPKGNYGDRAVNDWVAQVMKIYCAITAREPATSVGAPERDDEGVPGEPLIRFLESAAKPIRINPGLLDLTEGNPDRDFYRARAWRSRVRKIRAVGWS